MAAYDWQCTIGRRPLARRRLDNGCVCRRLYYLDWAKSGASTLRFLRPECGPRRRWRVCCNQHGVGRALSRPELPSAYATTSSAPRETHRGEQHCDKRCLTRGSDQQDGLQHVTERQASNFCGPSGPPRRAFLALCGLGRRQQNGTFNNVVLHPSTQMLGAPR